MFDGGISPGVALIALAALLVWVGLLVWLSSWIILRLRNRYGWKLLDWRTILVPFVSLTAAIHLGNAALDLLGGGSNDDWSPGFPNAFLIGSVAIGVGIAIVRGLQE